MNDTPETDTMYDNVWSPKVASDALIKMRSLCRKLERERNEIQEQMIEEGVVAAKRACQLAVKIAELEKRVRDLQTPNGVKSTPPCE